VGRPERLARAYFDPDVWEEDLARTTAGGREAAVAARRNYERSGIPIAQLRRVAEHGRNRTELPDCAKVYLPPPDGRFGMIFMLKFGADGRPVLAYLAFGVRHHPRGSQRPTVYQLAHERLRGQPPPR
jgi:hypothetical protein